MPPYSPPHHPGELSALQDSLFAELTGCSETSIRRFCEVLPDLPEASYSECLIGMGYLYEAFDPMFAIITASVLATQDASSYRARYLTVQNVLQPFCSEYGIEHDRPLSNPHRKLFADFFSQATGAEWPDRYPSASDNPWLICGRHWSDVMLARLQRSDLGPVDRARYNLGYHWAVEALSVGEFDLLSEAWRGLGFDAPYMNAHREVEEEHAGCAVGAVICFSSVDDPLVIEGARAHEDDLAGFYQECAGLVPSPVHTIA